MFRFQKQGVWFEMDSSSITLFFAAPCEALPAHPSGTKVRAAAHHFCLSSGGNQSWEWRGGKVLFCPFSALQGQEQGGRRKSAFPDYVGKFSAWLSNGDCS